MIISKEYYSGNLPVSKFCNHTVFWCSRVANFPRNGNVIISENYIAIAGEKLLRTLTVALRNLKK